MTLPTGTTLSLHTARVGACRVGAVRLGFVTAYTQNHLTGDGSPAAGGGPFYFWAEQPLATTTWTQIT